MLIDHINISYLDDLLYQIERIRGIVEEKNFENPYQIISEIKFIFEGLDNVFLKNDKSGRDLVKINTSNNNSWNWVSDWFLSLRANLPLQRKYKNDGISYKPEVLKKIMIKFIDRIEKNSARKYNIKKYIPLSCFIDEVKALIFKGFNQFDLFLLRFEERVGFFLAFLELYRNNIIDLKQKNNFIIFKDERL
jgi:hypothetical protein